MLVESTNVPVPFWFAVRSWRLHAVSLCSVCGYEIEYTAIIQMQLALALAGLR
jgi:hypothetical protein